MSAAGNASWPGQPAASPAVGGRWPLFLVGGCSHLPAHELDLPGPCTTQTHTHAHAHHGHRHVTSATTTAPLQATSPPAWSGSTRTGPSCPSQVGGRVVQQSIAAAGRRRGGWLWAVTIVGLSGGSGGSPPTDARLHSQHLIVPSPCYPPCSRHGHGLPRHLHARWARGVRPPRAQLPQVPAAACLTPDTGRITPPHSPPHPSCRRHRHHNHHLPPSGSLPGWARTAAAASSGACWASCTPACCLAAALSATGGWRRDSLGSGRALSTPLMGACYKGFSAAADAPASGLPCATAATHPLLHHLNTCLSPCRTGLRLAYLPVLRATLVSDLVKEVRAAHPAAWVAPAAAHGARICLSALMPAPKYPPCTLSFMFGSGQGGHSQGAEEDAGVLHQPRRHRVHQL